MNEEQLNSECRTSVKFLIRHSNVLNSIVQRLKTCTKNDGPVALAIKTGAGTSVIYYICKDHLGSLTGIMNAGGVMLEEYNYDPWGKRRNVTNWSYSNVTMPTCSNRGFTGHVRETQFLGTPAKQKLVVERIPTAQLVGKHLDEFDLIHMNGRIYDPEIARFLSPDPIIQDPYNLLNYNRYSYCLNNPLKYIDPSGYWFTNKRDPDGDCKPNNKEMSRFGVWWYNLWHSASGGGYTGGSGDNSSAISSFYYFTAQSPFASNSPQTQTTGNNSVGGGSSGSSNNSNNVNKPTNLPQNPSGGGGKEFPAYPENIASALGTLAGMIESGKVNGNMWFSAKTGKWYSMATANGTTGPRIPVLNSAKNWHNVAKGAFWAGAIISTGDMLYYYANGGTGIEKATWTGADITVGAIAMWGGPIGMAIGIAYLIGTNPGPIFTPSQYVTDPMSPWNTMPRIDNTGINNRGGF